MYSAHTQETPEEGKGRDGQRERQLFYPHDQRLPEDECNRLQYKMHLDHCVLF